jgi:hypothetical protein
MVATALYPRSADENKRKRWLKTHKAHLYEGQIHRIITALTRRKRADLARYFERHQQRMLVIRSASLNNEFDALWQRVA